MKKILVFNDSLELGGTEVLLVDLLNYLTNRGCVVTLLLPIESEKNILLRKVLPLVRIQYLYDTNTSHLRRKVEESTMIFFPSFFRQIKGIKAVDYDVVLCFKESLYACMFSNMRTLNILWIHNILYKRSYEIRSPKEYISVWLNKKQVARAEKSYARFDKVVCVSDACKDAYLNIVFGSRTTKQNIEIIYNALDLNRVIEKSKETIDNLARNVTNFVLVTRNSPDKRVDRVINAACQLIKKYDFHVYIIGDGLKEQYTPSYLAELGIDDVISIVGRVDNPYPYILQADWLLCVSERESFSLTLLEAMALNTPVITTNCGGPADIVDGGKYGILVNNSTEGVLAGMRMVLDDNTLSAKYSSDFSTALSRFSYEGWLAKIDKVLVLSK